MIASRAVPFTSISRHNSVHNSVEYNDVCDLECDSGVQSRSHKQPLPWAARDLYYFHGNVDQVCLVGLVRLVAPSSEWTETKLNKDNITGSI